MFSRRFSHYLPYALICSAVIFASSSFATSEEFKKWKQERQAEYLDYLTSDQKAFHDALKKDWEDMRTQAGKKAFTEPKIDIPPVAPEPTTPQPDLTPIPEIVIDIPIPSPVVPIPEPEPLPEIEPIIEDSSIQFDYLGLSFQLPELESWNNPINTPSSDVIADTWAQNITSIHQASVTLKHYANEYDLPDWALISVTDIYAKQLTNNNENNSQFIVWALLLDMGYDVRLGYDNSDIFLLIPSQQKIFSKKSITSNDVTYYTLIGKQPMNSLYTYQQDSGDKKSFDFSFSKPLVSTQLSSQKHTLKDDKNDTELSYFVYSQLNEYYRHHPQLEFNWYFKAHPTSANYLSLVDQLKQALDGKPERVQVQTILSLIQFGFEYELDVDQWGEEYYAAPMHTLMLRAADCEDRAFLFSFLVEEVVGLKTVGLHYPGHLAAAVAFTNNSGVSGKYVMLEGERYYVTDPTYIGASIGDEMPQYDTVAPKLITY
ncbi:hypothetical protein [Aliivibrio kagoshimensis]|uniref:hypothetical protein n=1 Tax=Aliivibrio kagoshimensis TaxID=2910230 RepID=UPI003D0FD653